MVYLISYDINERLFDYTDLKEVIKSLGDYQHPMDSLWFVSTEDPDLEGIYHRLKACLHMKGDHIFVLNIPYGTKRQGWMPRSFWKWLRAQYD